MYIDNPKKLFEDLINIETLYSYMDSMSESIRNNLSELISVIYNELDAPLDGTSLRWDIELGDKRQILKDRRTLKNIWNKVKNELKAKFVIRCDNCGKEYFYNEKPKYSADKYKCSECKTKGSLELLSFEDWASPEVLNLRNKYVY